MRRRRSFDRAFKLSAIRLLAASGESSCAADVHICPRVGNASWSKSRMSFDNIAPHFFSRSPEPEVGTTCQSQC